MTIKAALPRGPQDAREYGLGDGAARRTIAAATHLPRDHGPADRVFSPVVRGIQVQVKEKAAGADDQRRCNPRVASPPGRAAV